MLKEERQALILNKLHSSGKVVVSRLAVAGIKDGREYVVLSGLKAGDEIVSEGAGLVREGTQVK